MTQYKSRVEKQKYKLMAEEWAKGIKDLHVHSLDSMWYETPESRALKKNKVVTDIQYNGGKIERTIGKKKYILKKGLTGDALLSQFERSYADNEGSIFN